MDSSVREVFMMVFDLIWKVSSPKMVTFKVDKSINQTTGILSLSGEAVVQDIIVTNRDGNDVEVNYGEVVAS